MKLLGNWSQANNNVKLKVIYSLFTYLKYGCQLNRVSTTETKKRMNKFNLKN